MKKQLNCKTSLKPNIIDRDIFEKEINLCKKLKKENDGKCCWGVCDNCGVIPCLYKLYKGKVIDEKDRLKELKDKLLKN